MKLVDMVQFMWDRRTISSEMGWKIVILVPKGNADTRGMGLLGIFWKVMEGIIDTRINKAVAFHYFLRVFRTGMGAGKAIMGLNLVQDLASIYQDPPFLVFMDLIKAYDNLDRVRLLNTLEGYGVGKKCGAFWQSSGRGRRCSPNKMGTMDPSSEQPV